ncbi:MAG: hypothetical protein ABR585_15090, partial [Gemmatimonadaceae bacterium]
YSVSVGGPVFGWIPLGWRDPLVPWWGRCSSRCYERYNRPYAVDLAERQHRPATWYANASVPGAIIGGLLIGAGEKIAEAYLGPHIGGGIEYWFAYVLALAVLLVRPQGLLGNAFAPSR